MTDDATEAPGLADFDAFWGEQAGDTMPVRFEGVEYQVPLSPPVVTVLQGLRLAKAGADRVTGEEAFAIADAIVGKDNVAAILERNPSLQTTKLVAFVSFVARRQTQAAAPPNPAAPATGPTTGSTSSSGGRSSRRTSSGSTASTAPPG